MDESEFARSIDCDFPYNDRRAALAVIEQAGSISVNAMFIVLDEICRPGQGVEVATDTLLNLIDCWSERIDHPLAQPVVDVARLMAKGSDQSVDKALALMELIAPFKGLYGALSIAYLSCDDAGGLLEGPNNKIRAGWQVELKGTFP